MRSILLSALVFTALVMVQCNGKRTSAPALYTLLSPESTGIDFENRITDQAEFNIFNYRNFYNGGGVAIGDINNDQLPDIFFVSNMDSNRLYLNKGNFQFEDITRSAGVWGNMTWSTGVTMADVNNDGLLDIYLCNSGDPIGNNRENELYINNGDLTFTEASRQYRLNDDGYSTHACFFDYDQDGDLDCYVLNNSFRAIERVEQFTIRRELRNGDGGDKLYRNDGGVFTDVSESAGIFGGEIGFGLGVSVSDINGDNLPDIYISNDFWERDYLYLNKGNGTFSEEIINRTNVISGSSMGADVADINNDGSPEIFTTEMLPGDNYRTKVVTHFDDTNIKELKVKSDYHHQVLQNCLHFNDGSGNFQERAFISGVAATDWSWGALFFDMDLDGWKDIFVSNGIYKDITSFDFTAFVTDRDNIRKEVVEKGKFDLEDLLAHLSSTKVPNQAFLNLKNGKFLTCQDSLGLGLPSHSNGSAYADLDNDGDLDLVVNNVNMGAFVYRNNVSKIGNRHYLKFRFNGPASNRFGIGARVEVYTGENFQVIQNYTSRGFESSVEPIALFGLGSEKVADSVRVTWPDGRRQSFKNVQADQTLVINYSEANGSIIKPEKKPLDPLFQDITTKLLQGKIRHHENEFNDFNVERLLPHKLSTEGPKVLTGDVTNDGLIDFLVLGAYGDRDKLFIQQKDGRFLEVLQPAIVADSIYESTCGVFFDPDMDGDLDILIAPGGNEFSRGLEYHLLRFYENDGRGNFSKPLISKAPSAAGNFSVVLAEDFDQDGDPDLFIGGRAVPGNYGLVPRSFLFRNERNGRWTPFAPESLAGAGMVTDAVWSDVNGDGLKDLVVVGEWSPVRVYINEKGKINESLDLKGTNGWWSRIVATDLNNDGQDEFILGNWGLNTKFKASADKPLSLFVKDFDDNGKSEFILNWYPPAESSSFPFASRDDLLGQIPQLKKQTVSYDEFARKTYTTLFSESQRSGALGYQAYHLESAVLWLKDSGYDLKPLPDAAQVSNVSAILADDLDGDGVTDLFLLGNFYGLKPEVGRQDSNRGLVLKGNGCGDFTELKNSGVAISGEVRDVAQITLPDSRKILLVGRNDGDLMALQCAKPGCDN